MVSDINLCIVKVVLRDGDTKIENTNNYFSLDTLLVLTWHIFTIILVIKSQNVDYFEVFTPSKGYTNTITCYVIYFEGSNEGI